MNKLFLLFALGASLALAGCSDSSNDAPASTESGSAMTTAFVTTTTTMDTVANLSPSARSAGKGFSDNGTNLWTTPAGDVFWNDTASSPTLISPKDWMAIQLDTDAERSSNGSKISIFGRFREALTFFCAVGLGLDSTQLDVNNYPNDGTLTLTVTASLAEAFTQYCGIADAANFVGGSLQLQVSTPSDTTTYDKQVVLTLPTGGTQTFLLRSNESEINVATLEVNSYGISRTVVDYDLSTYLLKVEYLSAPDNTTLSNGDTLYTYRLLLDQANDQAYLMMGFHQQDSTSKDVRYILAGMPTFGSKYSLTMESSALNTGSYQACVSARNGDLEADNASCGVSTTTIAGVDVDGSVVDTFVSNWNHTQYRTIGAGTTQLTFSKTDFASAAFSQD